MARVAAFLVSRSSAAIASASRASTTGFSIPAQFGRAALVRRLGVEIGEQFPARRREEVGTDIDHVRSRNHPFAARTARNPTIRMSIVIPARSRLRCGERLDHAQAGCRSSRRIQRSAARRFSTFVNMPSRTSHPASRSSASASRRFCRIRPEPSVVGTVERLLEQLGRQARSRCGSSSASSWPSGSGKSGDARSRSLGKMALRPLVLAVEDVLPRPLEVPEHARPPRAPAGR